MSAELLTLLNANGINIDHIPGGIPEITQQDVILALQGASQGMFKLALFKLCGREEEKRKLYYELSVYAAGDNLVKLWVLANKGYYEKLCMLAINEINHTSTCKPCGGTGARKIKNVKLVTCEFCNGSGYAGLSARKRASQAGIKHKDWNKCKDIYNRILNILINWESSIDRMLRRKLRN